MRLVFGEDARRHGGSLHVHAVGPLLDGEHRRRVPFESRRAFAREDTVFPGVPRAHHVLAVEPPLAERAALVVAGAGDGPETAVVEEDRDGVTVELHGERHAGGHFVLRAESVPRTHTCSRRVRAAVTYAL